MRQTTDHDSLVFRAGRLTRMVAAALIAGVRRRETLDEIEGRVADLPRGDQVLIVGTTLGGLFLLSLIAAQFGLMGLGLYLLGVIFLVN
ncbi:MAG: hypothetical protein MUF73_10300 [Rhodobacteraceae bacterium]|jgi:hypothetical protein|nr:hypothetical protein [Paracoccaceae bacterium]